MPDYGMTGFNFALDSQMLRQGTADHIAEALSKDSGLALRNISNDLNAQFGEDNWELLSHQLTRLDRHFFLSVLFRHSIQ